MRAVSGIYLAYFYIVNKKKDTHLIRPVGNHGQ